MFSAYFNSLHCKSLVRRCAVVLALSPAVSVLAQTPDKLAFHTAAQAALGAEVTAIELRGDGWDACLGQAWSITDGWARWELTDYRRIIDYESGMSAHTAQRLAGMDPGRIGGCGAQPNASAVSQQGFIDASSAWPDQLLMWLTPHGFLKLLDSGTPAIAREGAGWQVTLPYLRDGITYSFVGNFNANYEIRDVTTWIDDAIFGDMEVRAEFGAYRDFGTLVFPSSLELSQGGFPILALDIVSAAPNSETLTRPERRAGAAPGGASGPAFTEIGEGIFAFHGAYQAVAVEFGTFSLVIDGLQSDARVQQLISDVKDAIPDKPIRYVVSTHSHFDHAYGLRQFAAEGATILTHATNVDFFQQALSTPRTLRGATATEPNVVPVQIEGIDSRYEISDGSGQIVELYALGPSAHAADMLVAYLPALKAVVEADVLQPWINPIFGGANGPHPFLVYLADELEKAGIDYERFVPIHVPPEPPLMQRADLEEVLGTGR